MPSRTTITDPTPRRVAVIGGDARQRDRWTEWGETTHYQARGDGGNGGLRRLMSALRHGQVDVVVILARWNGHSATTAVRTLCRKNGIRVEVVR